MRRLTTKEFVKKARAVHGDRYDYSKVEYRTTHESVCIICPVHGEFYQSPVNHLRGNNCPKCSKLNIDFQKFVKLIGKIHNNRYDYSKVCFTMS